MKVLPIVAAVLGAVVIVWEIPFIGSRTGLWPVLILLALGVMMLAVEQVRHGGQ